MSILLIALALAGSPDSDSRETRSHDDFACSVAVGTLDGRGHVRTARRVSASTTPSVVFRGKASPEDAAAPTLLFDVFNPRGQRYQVLVAEPRVVDKQRGGHRVERTSRVHEAALGVAGSSIAWTSMYGRWRVEPRLDGELKPCGRAVYFTIRP